jgi:nitrogen regulatory protein PII
MKEIEVYIKPHKLSQVTLALHDVEGLTGMSVTDACGFGRSRAKDEPRRIVEDLADYMPHVKIEVVCFGEIVERVIATIQEAAYMVLRGDGKIYGIETEIRIETGELGEGLT